MYPYGHKTLDEKTIKLTNFLSNDKHFAFIRDLHGLKGFPNFFTRQISSFLKTPNSQSFALV